ncbi:MAG TPA: hypothetical protein VLF38_07440, partial [Nocardioides sp.]|nr:hypothetical protein [Nocardioides sp.]
LPIHVAVPAGRGSQPLPDVALHRVSRMDELVVRVGIPRMRAEHAALRVASRAEGTDAVVAALADAVNWRVTTPQRLLGALPQLPRLPQRRLITEVSRTSPQERARCSSGGT